MIDPDMLPADPEAWQKPDISEPRSTEEFINDVWMCRKAPVYALRPKEMEILQSKTFKGWLWRLAMRLLRYSRPTAISIQANLEGTEPVNVLAGDPTAVPESERTMEHYLTIASRWPTLPEADVEPSKPDGSVASTLCDSSDFTPKPSRKPSKRRTTKKRKPRKSK
jgi:hypothetical protein